ncbi:MAG TPA: UDP-N-acetylglucosamine--N-acetylmuramyl-(pentapeptide) pyrophosphoryl-undecaprenol N-acetylglucosamine transferase [Candidatus Limnocylindrales bacterium]|nr:UDP-N-acetylglucosamine--N-acetylmuramyl-(pentapeptide) pyrophosphoryl-undecaprenol N-acetylglucosamine transferase [Candidatus Limnocylindrales bacterium]
MRLLVAGGGTGGHIYPALAVASSLRRRASAPEIDWIGGRRGLEDKLVREAGFPLRRLALRSLRSVDRDVHLVLDPLRLALSVPQATALLVRRRPAAIFTTGGYLAIPVMLAARPLGIPILMWEGNVIPGRSVRATARLAAAVAVSFAATCESLHVARCFETGTPIRDLGSVDRLAARSSLGVPPDGRVILVFGGSQAAARLNSAVFEVLPALAERWFVIHLTGDAGYAEALATRQRLPDALRARYRAEPFLREGMVTALAAADLVVGRAGSSTLAEVTAFGLPMVVVPYRYAGGHQQANAEALVAAGAARIVEDEAFDGPALLAAATILDDPATHAMMSAAARGLGRPAAADAVADLLLALATRAPLPSQEAIAAISRGGLA